MSESSQEAATAVHKRKTRVGVVVSNKMEKTIVVDHIAENAHAPPASAT